MLNKQPPIIPLVLNRKVVIIRKAKYSQMELVEQKITIFFLFP